MKKTATKKKDEQKDFPIKSFNDHKKPYQASIKIFGVNYSSAGFTPKECIENLKVGMKVGGICILKMEHGDKKREKMLNAQTLMRLFSSSRIMKEMAVKNVNLLFQDL